VLFPRQNSVLEAEEYLRGQGFKTDFSNFLYLVNPPPLAIFTQMSGPTWMQACANNEEIKNKIK
jgi:hypothetical protein